MQCIPKVEHTNLHGEPDTNIVSSPMCTDVHFAKGSSQE